MADFEAPERDAIEQDHPAVEEAGSLDTGIVEVDLEAPEADAVEQSTPVRAPAANGEAGERSLEADDADAAEQAHVVDFDDDEYR